MDARTEAGFADWLTAVRSKFALTTQPSLAPTEYWRGYSACLNDAEAVVTRFAAADAVEAPLAEQLAVALRALRPNVEDCLRYLSSEDYRRYRDVWDATRSTLTEAEAALAVFDAARADSQGTATDG